LICLQGLLGILRVNYTALQGPMLALIHGVFAQIVFAVLISVAVFTSRNWTRSDSRSDSIAPALAYWSVVTVLVVFGQLILGGLVRHDKSLLGPRGHLLGAFVVVAAVGWLVKLTSEGDAAGRFKMQRFLLIGLLAMQLMLGLESWLARFPTDPRSDLPQLEPLPMHAEWIRTAHYLVGTLIFSTTVVTALITHRKSLVAAETIAAPSRELEGAL
jgi:heme A synthase